MAKVDTIRLALRRLNLQGIRRLFATTASIEHVVRPRPRYIVLIEPSLALKADEAGCTAVLPYSVLSKRKGPEPQKTRCHV